MPERMILRVAVKARSSGLPVPIPGKREQFVEIGVEQHRVSALELASGAAR
jgi:hypothetical protein